jgi:hypothetical protein
VLEIVVVHEVRGLVDAEILAVPQSRISDAGVSAVPPCDEIVYRPDADDADENATRNCHEHPDLLWP